MDACQRLVPLQLRLCRGRRQVRTRVQTGARKQMTYALVFCFSIAGILLYLLTSASANTTLFARNYPLLLGLNAVLALALVGLIAYQLRVLWVKVKARVFGSKLTLRLVLMFAGFAVLPGVLVYTVSVQFVSKSIESWFDV